MDETIQANILHELRVIKKLLAHNLLMGDPQTTQISKLDSLGFQSKDIPVPARSPDPIGTAGETNKESLVAAGFSLRHSSSRNLKVAASTSKLDTQG